jgi:hypothetical protein
MIVATVKQATDLPRAASETRRGACPRHAASGVNVSERDDSIKALHDRNGLVQPRRMDMLSAVALGLALIFLAGCVVNPVPTPGDKSVVSGENTDNNGLGANEADGQSSFDGADASDPAAVPGGCGNDGADGSGGHDGVGGADAGADPTTDAVSDDAQAANADSGATSDCTAVKAGTEDAVTDTIGGH